MQLQLDLNGRHGPTEVVDYGGIIDNALAETVNGYYKSVCCCLLPAAGVGI
ncbi:hypothetical protein [Mycolicibacterium austroafricanum]|uniref:hypothetical protein n=1 Tax=Mycolicibacterium austroafricanum TaxID=39687 RepID=UPI000AF26C2C|nr:hypothetical protein [Mycolicibacterium austroafricanum]QZY47077.1 hypothetical protein K5L12_04840 [Mycolicibacterium austroafricanum]